MISTVVYQIFFLLFLSKQIWSSPEDCCSHHAGILMENKQTKKNQKIKFYLGDK